MPIRIVYRAFDAGRTGEFHQIGLGASSTGISVCIMGEDDRGLHRQDLWHDLSMASATACGIESKSFGSTHVGVHDTAIRNAIAQPSI